MLLIVVGDKSKACLMAAVVLGRWFLVDSFVRNFDSFATRFNFGREPMIEEMWKEFGFPNELPVPMNSCEQNERDTSK
jgi:hypothetical protein